VALLAQIRAPALREELVAAVTTRALDDPSLLRQAPARLGAARVVSRAHASAPAGSGARPWGPRHPDPVLRQAPSRRAGAGGDAERSPQSDRSHGTRRTPAPGGGRIARAALPSGRRDWTGQGCCAGASRWTPFACVKCVGRRRVLSYLTALGGVRAILEHLGLPTLPGRLAPARGPPQDSWV